jgi:hypothetical protein
MIHRSMIACLLIGITLHAATASGDYTQPSPNLVFQFEKQNRSHPWLRIATDSTRRQLKVRAIDEQGMSGFTSPEGLVAPREPLSWNQIGRIDEVVTRAHAYRVTGVIVFGLLGAGLGNALGAPNDLGARYALAGFAVFGTLGGWLGGRFGERFQHERNWYIADTTTQRVPSAAPVAAVPLVSEVAGATQASAVGLSGALTPPMSLEVEHVASRINSDKLIRLSGDFGKFQGFVGVAGPEGLERFVADPKAEGEWAGASLPNRIPWASVQQVHMRGGSGMAGALAGSIAFASLGALLGAAAVGVSGTTSATVGEGALLGAGLALPFGFVLGGGIGLLSRHWVVVYTRRASL